MLQIDIESVKKKHPFVDIISIGKSVLGKDLTVIKIGNGNKEVFYNGAIHANEWITAPVLMKFVKEYCNAIKNNSIIYGYSAIKLYNTITLYVMPMINPDGVNLVTGAISEGSIAYNNAKDISSSYPNIHFPSGWKANITGVDLKNYQPICKVL